VSDFLIDETEVSKSRRGRVAVTNDALVAILRQMKPGVKGKNAARLDSVFGSVEVSKRAGVSQQIKAHMAKVNADATVSVDYAPTVYAEDGKTILSGGYPQIRFKG